MSKFYFSMSRAKGQFYQKSKEAKDGFEAVLYDNGTKTTYHKYVKELTGVVSNFDVKEVTFDGKTFKMVETTLKNGSDEFIISFPQKQANGKNFSEEFRTFISGLSNYELGEPVNVSFYMKETEDKKFKNLNVYFRYVNKMGQDGKNLMTGFIPFSEIPRAEESVVAGDTVKTFNNQMEFFYNKFQEISKRISSSPTPAASTPAPQAAPPASAPIQTPTPASIPSNIPPAKDELPF